MSDTEHKFAGDCHARDLHEESRMNHIYKSVAQAALASVVTIGLVASCLPEYADAANTGVCAPDVRGDVQTWLDLGMKEHEIARMLAKRAYEDDADKISLCFIEWTTGNVGVSASTVYVHGDKKGKGRYNGRFATYTPSTTTWN